MGLPRVHATVDYNKIPQRFHKYPASDRAKKIMHEAITMDALFGTAWPVQWSTPEGPKEIENIKVWGTVLGGKSFKAKPQ